MNEDSLMEGAYCRELPDDVGFEDVNMIECDGGMTVPEGFHCADCVFVDACWEIS
jgi:hypothetical protein